MVNLGNPLPPSTIHVVYGCPLRGGHLPVFPFATHQQGSTGSFHNTSCAKNGFLTRFGMFGYFCMLVFAYFLFKKLGMYIS